MEGVQGTDESRSKLEQKMDKRRRDIRISWSELARRAGMTTTNLTRIRKNQSSISWQAIAKLERALQWAPGSIEAVVVHGREPKLAETRTTPTAESVDDLPDVERQRFLMARDFMRTQGRELTVRMWMVMRDEYDRLAALNRSSNPDHAL